LRSLLIRPGGIGDCITCFPVLEWLKTGYTEVWVPRSVAPLIRFADRVRAIADTGLDFLGIDDSLVPPSLIELLKAFDQIVSWYGTNRPEFRDAALTINPNWQFLPALPPAGSTTNATDFHAAKIGAPLGLIPRIKVGHSPPRSTVAIHPFSGGRAKNWPLDRFQELASRLPLPVGWIAGPEEDLDNAFRFDNLMDLAHWLRSATLYIGNDSGITHLAAAIGLPTLALFGPTDPRVWLPRGVHVSVVARSSMDEINVDEALSAAIELLTSSARQASAVKDPLAPVLPGPQS
jgi:hypothetical protein